MNNNKPKMAANSPILPMTEHYARLLLKRLRLERECNAVWTDDDTASTDGTIINLPRQAFGVTLDRVNYKKKALILSKGLGLHEVAHFTQNLRKLSAHCRQNGVNKFYSNILLDAQADKSILKLLREEKQYFIGKRKIMRRSVWPTYMRDMEEAKRLHEVFAQSGDYADYLAAIRVECSTLALIGKYKSNIRAHTNAGKFAVSDYGKALTKFIAKTPISEQGLFQYIKSFGVLFPELCDSDPITLDEESQIDQGYDLSPEGEESDREIETLSMAQRAELDSCLLTLNYLPKLSKRKPAMQEARALAEKLHPMLSMDYDVKKVTVPVRLDRRKMARGVDPIPFYDNRKHGKERARKLTLFVDRSGSMGGIMSIVKIAAQAICIAVQRRGGSVAAGYFNRVASTDPDFSDAPLFADVSASGGTSFEFLTEVWRQKPGKILVLTDGAGQVPALVRPEDKERTFVVSFVPVNPNSDIYSMAAKVLICDNLQKLPKLLAQLAD